MSNLGPQFATKDWNPFLAASNLLDKAANTNRQNSYMFAAQNRLRETASTDTGAPAKVRETPTPENTGAPIPGQRQRGSNITPQSTGAPMPKTTTPSGRIPAKSTKRFPKMDKKQTAPGTRPKKK